MAEVSFIGVGAIGLPMATTLARGGHTVTAVDPSEAARHAAEAVGLHSAASLAAASHAGTVVVMVATPDQLAAVVTDALPSVRGQLWVVMSTVGPESVRREAARLTGAGARVSDAPVTGGAGRAAQGDLVMFASGPADTVTDAAAVLRPLGTVKIVGPSVGDGQAVKVINQHLCAVHIAAAAEALHLAASLGVAMEDALDDVSGGAAGSWMLSDRGPRMLLGSEAPVLSTVDIFVKDTGLVAQAAESVGASVPLLAAAQARFAAAHDAGLGRRDDSRVIETYQAEDRG